MCTCIYVCMLVHALVHVACACGVYVHAVAHTGQERASDALERSYRWL